MAQSTNEFIIGCIKKYNGKAYWQIGNGLQVQFSSNSKHTPLCSCDHQTSRVHGCTRRCFLSTPTQSSSNLAVAGLPPCLRPPPPSSSPPPSRCPVARSRSGGRGTSPSAPSPPLSPPRPSPPRCPPRCDRLPLLVQ